jgi:hypothetical protein
LLCFIATWKPALVHDLAEMLTRADQNHSATIAGPNGKGKVVAKELFAAHTRQLHVRVQPREKRVCDHAVGLDQERFKGLGHMDRTLERQIGQAVSGERVAGLLKSVDGFRGVSLYCFSTLRILNLTHA